MGPGNAQRHLLVPTLMFLRPLMKKSLSLLVFLICAGLWSAAQANRPADLQTVLNLMDRTAATLRTVETDFTWDDYERVVDNHDYQKGVMYFSRSGKRRGDVRRDQAACPEVRAFQEQARFAFTSPGSTR